MKTVVLFSLLLFAGSPIFSQINKVEVKNLEAKELPDDIKYKGNIIEALSWNDINGENIFISSVIGPVVMEQAYGEPWVRKEIFAKQYILKSSMTKLLWDNIDVESVCPMHNELEFIPNSASISDLDGDGITETTVVYRMVCRSDVSLAEFVVLMQTNQGSFGLRGHTLIRIDNPYINMDLSQYEFNLEKALISNTYSDEFSKLNGRYSNVNDFKFAPPAFLNYAIEVWKKYVEEKF